MNILNVAELLDSVCVKDVVYGTAVVERCNAALPEELHFSDALDGNEIALRFDDLPDGLKEALQSLEVLLESEVEEFVQAATRLKDRVRERQLHQDATALSLGGYFSVISVVIALGYVLIYVFHSIVDGDAISGAMFNALVYIWHMLNESVVKK